MKHRAFTEFEIFPNKEDYKSEHLTLDRRTLENDLNKISYTFVDLKKFEKKIEGKKVEELSKEEKFYYFLTKAEDISVEELEEITKSSKLMIKAFKELNRVYWTEEEIIKYEAEEKREKDNKAILKHATTKGKDKGRKEGKEEGIQIGEAKGIQIGEAKGIQIGEAKGRKEEAEIIAINLLNNGIDIQIISQSTRLTEEEILSLALKFALSNKPSSRL